MPEAVPAPNSVSDWSGNDGSTWFQFFTLPCAAGSQIFFSWSTVRHLAQVLSLLTTIAMPSFATWISSYLMPFFSQAGRFARVVVLDRPRGVGHVGLARRRTS